MPPNDPANPPGPPSPPANDGPTRHEPDPPAGAGATPAASLSGMAAAVHAELAAWCHGCDKLLRLARRSGPRAGDVRAITGSLAEELARVVERHGALTLELTPRSLALGGVPVFEVDPAHARTGDRLLEHELPWLLHRDGVRRLRLLPGLTTAEVGTLVLALVARATSAHTHEDLVTCLWDAAPRHVRLECEEQSAVRFDPLRAGREEREPPHVSDWPLHAAPVADVHRLWEDARSDEARAMEDLRERWRRERAVPFADAVDAFVTRALARDPRPELAEALTASVVTWLATALQRGDWDESLSALEVLWHVDPRRGHADEFLEHALGAVDAAGITERLDGASAGEQGRFFAFAVSVGAPALPLLASVLATSEKARVRAGVTTALAHAFADDPAPLAHWLADTRWHVVRNIVFVLGQIGGPQVVPLLAHASRHLDVRVRRAAVHALGQVPPAWRRSVLIAQLDAQDPRLLSAALAMLARDPDARIADSLLARVIAPEFAARSEEERVLLLGAVPELGGDTAVPALAQLVVRGGWFALASAERTAAALALRRIGSLAARAALEQGLRHRSAAVREACEQALGWEESA